MKILALEFSSSLRSVAIVESQTFAVLGSTAEKYVRRTGLELIEEVIQAAALDPLGIELIAVGLGPGSYSGIRSSIAIAQGWRLGLGTATTGVSSIETLAEQARLEGVRGECVFAVDAQRGEIYRARYDLQGGEAVEISPLAIVPISSLAAERKIFGPEASQCQSGARDLCPSAVTLARLAAYQPPVPASALEPIYLREVSFLKAVAPRQY